MSEERDDAAARLEEIRRKREEEFRPLEYAHADYRWDRTQEKFWDIQTYQLVSAIVVDKSIPEEAWRLPEPEPGSRREPRPVKPSSDIPRVREDLTVHASTWHPGKPQIIENMLADDSGYTYQKGTKLFNTYRAPRIGAAKGDAKIWFDLVKMLFPNEAEYKYFFDFCAHMIQKPHEKCNAGVVLSGTQGVGKDAILLPLKECVGYANARNIGPDTLFSEFNEFVKSVMLVMDEVRSHKDDHRATAMYNKLKELCAAPPNMLRMNLKRMQPVWVANLCRVFMTTNEVDGMFIPQDDRRLFILHTDLTRADDAVDFNDYWDWIKRDGAHDLWHALKARDISGFRPNAEPPKTAKHTEVAQSWGFAADSPMATVFNSLRNEQGELPEVLSGEMVKAAATELMVPGAGGDDEEKKVKAALGPRQLNRTMAAAGYVGMANPEQPGGLWREKRPVDGKMHEQKLAMYRRVGVKLADALVTAKRMLSDSLSAKIRRAVITAVPDPKDNV